MTYLTFLCVFLVPPIIALGVYFFKRGKDEKPAFMRAMALLCLLAFAYTTPWDNYLVASNIWSYGKDRVLGVIGFVPYEEYAFFFLQTILCGHWAHLIHKKLPFVARPLGVQTRAWAVLSFILLETAAISLLGSSSTQYLGLITAWSLPVIFIQFYFGQESLLFNWRYIIAATAPPTLYLWAADLYAIRRRVFGPFQTHTPLALSFLVCLLKRPFFSSSRI